MKPLILLSAFVLSGCALVEQMERPVGTDPSSATTDAPTPPTSARTVEDFDTTSASDRAAAASGSVDGRKLGETIASLGDPSSPGFWIETPLVTSAGSGRLVWAQTGAGVDVELRPSEGGSSRVSLAALRVLGAPLTDLVTLEVFAGG